jgi:pimeloyl-ACP methyl ester carboxylesterase
MENVRVPHTSIHRVDAEGVSVFYRQAGPPQAPVVLLLHGFPASSFQYRELIPRLAGKYRVIAPDLPGFGFTDIPEKRQYKHSFDGLARRGVPTFQEVAGKEGDVGLETVRG